ncbi:MAG: hypothetical protein GEU94_04315 [Micromonosporaceae bacterium]|nr:hypothetical protein [Micromonosporaceae bacterium]
MSALRRIRDHAGLLALLAVMAALAAFLATAMPRLLNHIEDASLRRVVSEAPSSVRDVVVAAPLDERTARDAPRRLRAVEDSMSPLLRSAVSDRWHAAQAVAGVGVAEEFPDYEGRQPEVDVRVQDGLAGAVRLTEGALPAAPAPRSGDGPLRLEAVISAATAETLNVTRGSEFLIESHRAGTLSLRVVVSGVFEPKDPKAPIWQGHPQSLHPAIPRPSQANPPTYLATALTHPDAAAALAGIRWEVEAAFRYRLDERRFHAGQTQELLDSLRRFYAGGHGVPDGLVSTGLDHVVEQFQARRAAVAAVAAVVFASLLGAMLGVLLLAARLVAERRRRELALWRARGASVSGAGASVTADAALAVVPAVIAGTGLALLLPGRPAGPPWLAIGIGLAALAAVGLFAAPALRRTTVVAARGEAKLLRPSARRLTVEVTVLVLAAFAVVLLRRRGLFQAAGIDPYLSATPVLLGLAAALATLRVYPWPLRLAGRLASGLRGAVTFLGAARAGRSTPAAALPLAVLVIATALGVFSGVVRASVDDARDRAAWQEVGADVRLHGVAFDRSAAAAVADVPGVRATAAMTLTPATKLRADDTAASSAGTAVVLAVDAPAYQRVLDAAGIDHQLPRQLVGARPGTAVLPALASPGVAKLTRHGRATLGNGEHRYRVAGVVDWFPGLRAGVSSFLILPLQALPASGTAAAPVTDLLVAGPQASQRRLEAVAAEEQRAAVARTADTVVDRLDAPAVLSRSERRAEAERDGLNAVLTLAFTAGVAGAAGFALLAVGFAIAVTARSRGRAVCGCVPSDCLSERRAGC